MRIALDAMGGDCGAEVLLRGALAAVEEERDNPLEVLLAGPEHVLGPTLDGLAPSARARRRLHIVPAAQVVGMDESPVEGVRRKKDSTIVRAFGLLRGGEVQAVVSAGNSGATLAAAVRSIGRLDHVMRPGIMTIFPTVAGQPLYMMDGGANVECRPQHLVQFAVMAGACSRLLLGVERPRIGLLSIGEETGKGNTLVKETHALFEDIRERLAGISLDYRGNVEGNDVFRGDVNVIVCDGFVGNICLKISEGLADAALRMLRDEIQKSLWAKLGYLLSRSAFAAFRKRVDYAEYGGAPLLGINGTGIICHGSSNSEAIKNALMVAERMVSTKVNERIAESLAVIEEAG